MPLIVRDPHLPVARRGVINDVLVLNVDVAPTILRSVCINAPPAMQGHDLTPLIQQVTPADWRSEHFYEHAVIQSVAFIPSSQALVTTRMKYIYWPDFKVEELFDVVADPHEERNLIADPAQAVTLTELRKRFATRLAETR